MSWALIQNSLMVSAATTVLAGVTGFGVALWTAGLARLWRRLMLGCAVVALALPPFLVVNCWLHYLGGRGVWRSWVPFDLYSPAGVVLVLTLMFWPVAFFWSLASWTRLDRAHLDSDPGLTGRWLVRGLLLPAARPALVQAGVLTFVLALNNFAVPAILQVKVFPAELWIAFNTLLESRRVLWIAVPMAAVPMLALWWFRRQELEWPRFGQPVSSTVFRRQLGRGWHAALGAGAIFVVVLSVGLPVLQLCGSERTWAELPSAVAAGSRAAWNSVWFAAVPGVVGVLVGLLTWRWPMGALTWIPFFLSGVLLGLFLIRVLNRPLLAGVYQSAGVVFIALSVRYLAIGWHGAAQGVRAVDLDLTDAARLDGATSWQLFRRVQWPQVAPQLAAAWYVTYLLCLWDVESLVLIIPPGGETLALRVFNLLHYGHDTHVNALCLILLGLAVLPLVLWWAAGRVRGWMPRRAAGLGCAVLVAGVAAMGGGCSEVPGGGASLGDHVLFSQVEVIGSRGVGVGQFSKPRSVAVDLDDNLYVIDMTGRVQKFAPDGTYVRAWQMPEIEKGRPKGMCRDQEGNVVVVEPHYSRVNHFAPDGRLVHQWGQRGTNAGALAFPRDAVVNSRGEIYVSEYGLVERVQRFGAGGGTLLNVFGGRGEGPGGFNRAEGLGIDAQDHVYVADSCNHRVQIFDREGQFLRAYGRPGSGPGELSYPYDVCVDDAGMQFVCEYGNSRIQIFGPEGDSVGTLGGPGTAPGQFSNPWSVALDSRGNLYVADSLNHRVQKFVRRHPLSAVKKPSGNAGGASRQARLAVESASHEAGEGLR